ncbi:MAG: protein kinase [Myxococcota bacterium]
MKPTETSLTDVLGQEFGPYKLVRRLGVGGMAETFVAIRSGPSGFTQRVCLKLVLPFFRENEEFLALFEREARLAAKLRHRNIVGVIDFGEYDGTSYMALELVDGLDLRSILDSQKRERIPSDYVSLLGIEIAEALDHAHNPPADAGIESGDDAVRGIVHRDISPSNVLVSKQGEFLLTDFGVAKAMSGGSRKQSAVKGKVPYMSPEQLRAEPLDGRADLFALGVVLFESLAGQRPYEGAHDPGTIMKILSGEHPSLKTLAPDAPDGLCEVVESMIAADRNDRPDDAAALIELLADFAPSPRARRKLGKLVEQLSEEAQQKKAAKRSSEVRGSTRGATPSGASVDAPELEPPSAPSSPEVPAPTGSPSAHAKTEILPDQRDASSASAPTAPATPRGAPEEPRARSVAPTVPPPPVPESAPPTAAIPEAPSPEAARAPEPFALVRSPKVRTEPIPEPSVARDTGDRARPSSPRREPPAASASDGSEQRSGTRRGWILAAIIAAAAGGALFFSDGLGSSTTKDERPGTSPEARVPEAQAEATHAPETKRPTPSESAAESTAEPSGARERDPRDALADTAQPEEKPKPATRPKADANPRPGATQAKSSPPKATVDPKTPARLTVTVVPWGNIWINGKPWGPAPLDSERLPPGTYKVSVGQRAPDVTRRVRLRPGQKRTVRFDLSR